MTETVSHAIQNSVATAHSSTGSTRVLLWLALTAIALLISGLWIYQSRIDQSVPGSAEVETTIQSSGPATAEIPNPYADWKPPAMPEPAPYSSQKLAPELVTALKERWGVELLGIRQSGAGMFLDFRFKVLDADKSLPLFDHRIKPYLVAEKSEIKLPIPQAAKVGSFRPTNRGKNIKAGKTYYMLFANPDRYVKSGEKVSVVIGDFKAEQLTVQ
ncbi:MAG: hypothetical protein WBO73_17195 [Gammaproteobacteria bacterium]